jgi:hypothetical protein
VPGLREYGFFLDDLSTELDRIESRSAGGRFPACKVGCSDCCTPLTLLPLEAYAIVAYCESHGVRQSVAPAESGTCAFLTPERACTIYPARPYLCRTRGCPILHVNGDGELERDSCSKRDFLPEEAGSAGLALEYWNARLFRLNEAFCAQRGIAPRRVRLSELFPAQSATISPACL